MSRLLFLLLSADVASSSTLELVVSKLARLELPIYGAEHLLALQVAGQENDQLLPMLLPYDQGILVEGALSAEEPATNKVALAASVIGRRAFFERAAPTASLPIWELATLAQKGNSQGEVMATHLAACGWVPTCCMIAGGSIRSTSSTQSLGMRDLGAFTEPSPSSVRLDDAGGAVLACERAAASGDVGSLEIPLESVAEALALARTAPAAVPIRIPTAAWEQRAVAASQLPEFGAILWERTPGHE